MSTLSKRRFAADRQNGHDSDVNGSDDTKPMKGDAMHAPGPDESQVVRFIRLELLLANPSQPRREFDQERLEQLAASLAKDGFLQPIIVRPFGKHFQIVCGERRKRAAEIAKIDRAPCLIRQVARDADMLIEALIENEMREELNPLDRASLQAVDGRKQDEPNRARPDRPIPGLYLELDADPRTARRATAARDRRRAVRQRCLHPGGAV